MKIKKQHIEALRSIQKCIAKKLINVLKEAHIPICILRIWGEKIKSAANFMQRG